MSRHSVECYIDAAHVIARANSNGELSFSEEVQDVRGVGVGLELAAGGGAVRAVVLVNPTLKKAEPLSSGAGRRRLQTLSSPSGAGRRRLQGHHELVVHGTVDAAVVDDAESGGRAGADSQGVGRPSANAGDQEREVDHPLESPSRVRIEIAILRSGSSALQPLVQPVSCCRCCTFTPVTVDVATGEGV